MSIRWKRSDFIKLGIAVSKFNSKINKVLNEENKNYIPTKLDYQNLKNTIQTRKEFNQIINSIKRFQKEGSENLYTTQAGVDMTKWERREYSIKIGAIKRSKNAEIQRLKTPSGEFFTPEQMGFQTQTLSQIENTIKSLSNIETKKGYELDRVRTRINDLFSSDVSYKRAITFRSNYLEELEDLKNNDEAFKKLYEKLEKIKDPYKFYDVIQQSKVLNDFLIWYKDPTSYGSFRTSNEISDKIFDELGW